MKFRVLRGMHDRELSGSKKEVKNFHNLMRRGILPILKNKNQRSPHTNNMASSKTLPAVSTAIRTLPSARIVSIILAVTKNKYSNFSHLFSYYFNSKAW